MTPEEKRAKANERHLRWRRANPERLKEIQAKSREKNKEKIAERRRVADKRRYDEGRKTQSRVANPENYREWYQKWYAENKERLREKHKQYRLANPEKVQERHAKYHREHRDELKAKSKAHHTKNKEREAAYAQKYRAAHREHRSRYTKKWQAANPEKVRATRSRRDARISASSVNYSADDVVRLKTEQKNRCATCRVSLRKTGYHIDHVMPVSRGGTNAPDNIQLLCPSCNHKKSAKHPDDWAAENGLLFY